MDTERNVANNHLPGEFVCGWVHNGVSASSFQKMGDLDSGTYWAWNLSYDIEGMLRDLAVSEGWAAKVDGVPFTIGEARCVYYHGKRFEYREKTKGLRTFVDASPFFNKIALAQAVKALCKCTCINCKIKDGKHCGIDFDTCPVKGGVDASKMSLKRYRADPIYQKTVDEYCALDARLALKLAVTLADGLKALKYPVDIGGTPGATARRYLAHLPPFSDVCWNTHHAFLKAYCGGKFEAQKRGGFEGLQEHDLVSAYPSALARCPFLTQTAYNYFTNRMNDDALYGAYQISGSVEKNYLGLMPTWKGNTRVFSAKEDKVWITRPELMLMQDLGFEYKIHSGVEVKDPNATMRFKDDIDDLFATKTKYRKEPVGLGSKVILNSEYGVMIMLVKKPGKWVEMTPENCDQGIDFAGKLMLLGGEDAYEAGQYYAPIYAGTLTSLVRADLYRGCMEIGFENLVATHTDSIMSIGGKIKCGDGLGSWELKETLGEGVIAQTGKYSIGEKVKGRGIAKRKLDPNDDSEIAKRHKEDLWAIQQLRRSRTGIKTAKSWNDVSVIKESMMNNNFATENKRFWFGELTESHFTNKKWIDSEPLKDLNWKPTIKVV